MIPSSYKPIGSDSPPRSPETQPSVHKRLLKKVQAIDKSFVVSKLFYFFFYTALGALFPFFSLYYKQLWLTPSQVGILLALRPTVKLICLPLWKMITDKYSRPKAVYFISIFGWLIGYYGQTLVYTSNIPCYSINASHTLNTPFPSTNSTNSSNRLNSSFIKTREWDLRNTELQFQPKYYLNEERSRRSIYDEIITDESKSDPTKNKMNKEVRRVAGSFERSHVSKQETPRNMFYTDKNIFKRDSLDDDDPRRMKLSDLNKEKKVVQQETDAANNNKNLNLLNKDSYKQNNLQIPEINSLKLRNEDKAKDSSSNKVAKEEKNDQESAFLNKELNNDASPPDVIEFIKPQKHLGAFQEGNTSKSPKPSEDFRVQYNFWILRTLIVIVILTEIITSPTPMIADSAVIQSLAESNSDYGRQRLFGFFGLGLAATLVAIWVSYYSDCLYTDTINYLPCFYIFLIAIGATVVVSLFFNFQTPENNRNESKLLETLKIFKSPRYGFFLFTIFFTGFAHSLQISFLFWFLQDMGGTPTLFAIIILIHSVSEVVMYFLAPYLNQAVGHQGTICVALACYTARFLMYGSLEKPWLILPMEMVQGLTYGGMWSVSTVYIQAPEEATKMVQSILHGMYWGVGMATGALVSGFVIEAYGVQDEFLVMSLLMAIMSLVHLFILICDRIEEMEGSLQRKRDSGIDKLQPEKKKPENYIGAAAAPLVPCLLYGR